MSLPNKITIGRILLIPFFMFFLMQQTVVSSIIATVLFIIAAVTDGLDGYVARRYDQITTFGKFADPLADKLLIISALVCMVELGYIGSLVTVIIIARELVVTGLRLVAVSEGTVIAASIFGKIKTVLQIVAVIAVLMLAAVFPKHIYIGEILMWIAAVATVLSGVDYLVKNRDILKNM